MSDYLFMLDSHLDAGQNRVVSEMQQLATAARMNVWLTGGAMRDMLQGRPIRDLDFTVENDAAKTGRNLAGKLGGEVVAEDASKRWVELLLPGNVRASVGNARSEKYPRPGGKPQIAPATIHADLARRDFTINAIALSLSRGSRGLLVDPCNGEADLLNKELRTTNSYAFFDDPARVYRLFRFQHVYGLTPTPRTLSQMENALLGDYLEGMPANTPAREIRAAARDGHGAAMLRGLDERGLLKPLSAALTGAKLNFEGLEKLEGLARTELPPGSEGGWLAFLMVLVEKLGARERTEVMRAFELSASENALWKKLDAAATGLEASLKGPRSGRPSQVWEILQAASCDEILLVLYRSEARTVQDRIRAYFEKYLPTGQEVTDEEVMAAGGKPGSAKFQKLRRALITSRLNAKPRKVEEAEPEDIPMSAAGGVRGRG